jgi:polysaccharide biosynthesis/export protein
MEFVWPARADFRPRPSSATSIVAALALACALTPTAPLTAQTGGGVAYRLGPDDEIAVQVLEDAGLATRRRVAASGTVVLPLVGEIAVGGLTAEEAAQRIKEALERQYLQQATVEVQITEHRSQPVSITGAVGQPGNIYLDGPSRLSQAIAAAGGLAAANQGRVLIRRTAANGLTDELEVDLAALMERGDRSVDVPILAHDAITIPVAADITVYFLGEISSQGAVTIKGTERATLLTAIARAGGLTDRAASKVTIRRNRGGEQPLEIVANFRRILAGSDPDIELEDGDLIVVKEAFL